MVDSRISGTLDGPYGRTRTMCSSVMVCGGHQLDDDGQVFWCRTSAQGHCSITESSRKVKGGGA